MVLAGCSVDSIEEREYASRNIMPKDGTPYELEFMQQVVSEVAGTRAPMTELQPTHLYVEFAPATLEEYDRLQGLQCSGGGICRYPHTSSPVRQRSPKTEGR